MDTRVNSVNTRFYVATASFELTFLPSILPTARDFCNNRNIECDVFFTGHSRDDAGCPLQQWTINKHESDGKAGNAKHAVSAIPETL